MLRQLVIFRLDWGIQFLSVDCPIKSGNDEKIIIITGLLKVVYYSIKTKIGLSNMEGITGRKVCDESSIFRTPL